MRMIVLIALALALPLAAAAPRLSFRSVHYTPHPVRAGEAMRISFNVHIDDGPMTPAAVVEEVPRRPGPPPPIIVLAKLESGDHMIDVFRYVVPTTPPERVCFKISLPGGELRDACLRRFRGSDGAWWMDVDTPGRWVEVFPTPTPVPSSGSPDLKLVGNIAVDSTIILQNIGTATANNIRVRKACFVDGRWVRVGGDREVRILAPGAETRLAIGRLGSALGPCPTGFTRVRIAADPNNDIAELDENNNALEVSALPDLAITAFEVDYPIPGIGVTPGHHVRFTVSNTGVADAGRFAWEVSVLVGDRWGSVTGSRIAGLAAGRTVSVDTRVGGFAKYEGAQARLTVDALNEITETNEDNNRATTTVVRPRR